MRIAGLLFCAALAACGDREPVPLGGPIGIAVPATPAELFAREPRVTLPLTAPEGADPNVRDFLEICSRAIMDQNAALGEAATRGWTADPQMLATAALSGMLMLTREGGDISQGQIQLNAIDFPHLKSRNCMLMRFRDNVPETLSFEVIEGLRNVRGDHTSFPAGLGPGSDSASRGVYSFVTDSGEVVSILVLHAPPTLLNMSMSRVTLTPPSTAAASRQP